MTKAQKDMKDLAQRAAEGKKLSEKETTELYAAANGKRNHEDTPAVGRRLLLNAERTKGFFMPASEQPEPAPTPEPAPVE